MKRFGKSTLKFCNLNNVNIICYEPHTCESIRFFGRDFTDVDAEKYLKICPTNPKNGSFIIVGSIIIICIVVIFIIGLVTFRLIKKSKFEKSHNKLDSKSNSENQSGRVVFINNNDNNIMNSLSINNNQNNNNTQDLPLPPSYDETNFNVNNNNITTLYFTSNIDNDELLPEYTEFNSLII